MSKSKQSRDTRTVYITRNAKSDKRWHSTDDPEECYNTPEDCKAIELWKLKDMYEPCAICSGEDPDTTHNCNQARFKCSGCGQEQRLGVTAVRTLHGCKDCEDVTNWERIDDVRQ